MQCYPRHAFRPFPGTRDLFCAGCGATKLFLQPMRQSEPRSGANEDDRQLTLGDGTMLQTTSAEVARSEEIADLDRQIAELMREKNLTLEEAVFEVAQSRIPETEEPRNAPVDVPDDDRLGANGFI